MEAVIDFISNTPKSAVINDFQIWGDNPISITKITIIAVLILIIILLIFYIFRMWKTGRSTSNFIISMPSMKELEALAASREP